MASAFDTSLDWLGRTLGVWLTIRFWNPGAVRILGFTSQEALGQSLNIIIPVALRERHWQGYTQSIRTGHTRYGAGDVLAVPALRKDGTRISVEFSIIPFRDAAGRIGVWEPSCAM